METQLIIFTQESVNHIPNNSSFDNVNTTTTPLNSGWQINEPTGPLAGTTPLINSTGYLLFVGNTGYGQQSVSQQTVANHGKQYKLIYHISYNSNLDSASNDNKLKLIGGGSHIVNADVTLADDVGTHQYIFTCNANNGIIEIALQTMAVNVNNNSLTIDYIILNPLAEKDTLDLFKDETIPITYTVNDIRDVSSKNTSYSKDFDIPATKKNNKYFNHIYEITADSTFNPYRRARAIVNQQGTTIFEGYLQLMKITKKGNGEIIYKVNLFNSISNFAEDLKDKKLFQVPLHDLNHNIAFAYIFGTGTGIMETWNSAGSGVIGSAPFDGTSLIGDNILYPMVNYKDEIVAGPADFSFIEESAVFRPWIKIKTIFDRIFSNAGYTYTSEFLDGDVFSKLYMDLNYPSNGKLALTTNINPSSFHTSVALAYSQTLSYSATAINLSIINRPDSTLFGVTQTILNGSDYTFNTTTNDSFVSDIDGLHLTVGGSVHLVFANANSYCHLELHHTGSGVGGVVGVTPMVKVFEPIGATSYPFTTIKYFTFDEIILDNTETAIVKARGVDTTITSAVHPTVVATGVTATNLMWNISRPSIVPNELLELTKKDYSQWDFVNSFIKIFNLMIEPDADNPYYLKIEPYNDFVDSGQTHDWTDKVDMSSDTGITIIGDLTKNVLFKYTDDENDYCLQQYKKTLNAGGSVGTTFQVPQMFTLTQEEYGSHTYMTDRDYYDDKTTIVDSGIFAPTVFQTLFHTLNHPVVTMPAMYGMDDNGDSQAINNKPRLLFNTGVHDLPNNTYSWYFYTTWGGTPVTYSAATSSLVQATKILLFSHYSKDFTDANFADAEDVNFGIVQPFVFNDNNVFGGNTLPPNNVFTKYWKKYIDLVYSSKSRLITYYIYLSPEDILNFTFRDKVKIKGETYRVNRIEYIAGAKNNKTKIELLKII